MTKEAQLGRSWTVLIMLCNLNNLQLGIVTRWLEYLLNIWPFRKMKICPKVNIFAKVGSHFGLILNIYSRNGLLLFNLCPSGEISTNLVTLVSLFVWYAERVLARCEKMWGKYFQRCSVQSSRHQIGHHHFGQSVCFLH